MARRNVFEIILRTTKQGRGAEQAKDDLKDVEKQSGKTEKSVSKLGTAAKVAAAAGLAVLASAAANFARQSVQAASAVEEMRSKFNVVFGREAESVTQQLENFADQVNRSKFELMAMASSLQDTFVPMGFARGAAADLSVQLAKLAVDVGSFNDVADADVARDFQSALVGNTETVRKYGIVITEANTKQEAYRSGIAEVGAELTDQQKVQARLNLILDGTTDAQGDAARTSDSYANTLRGAQAAVKDLQVAIGDELIPTLIPLISLTSDLVNNLVGLKEITGELNNAFHESAQSAVATGMTYDEYNRSVTENLNAVEQLIFAFGGLTREEFEAVRATDAVTLASRQAGEQMRDVKSAGLEAQEGMQAVAEGADGASSQIQNAVDALAGFSREALGAKLVNRQLMDAMKDGAITEEELSGVKAMAQTFGVDLPEDLAGAVSHFNSLASQGIDPATASAQELKSEVLGIDETTQRLTAGPNKVIYEIEVIGDPIPPGGGGGGGSPVTGGGGGPVDINGQHGGSMTFGGRRSSGNDQQVAVVRGNPGERLTVEPGGGPGGGRGGPLIGTVNITRDVEGMALVESLKRSVRRL